MWSYIEVDLKKGCEIQTRLYSEMLCSEMLNGDNQIQEKI